MSLHFSFLILVGLGTIVVVLRGWLKSRFSRNLQTISGRDFVEELRADHPEFPPRLILIKREKVALALAVPVEKLKPTATREQLIESFSVFGDTHLGWGDLEEELEDVLGIEADEIRTVADLVVAFCKAELDG